MSFEFLPDSDPHEECRHEIHRLEQEVERLQLYERAMQSMVAQYVYPHTAKSLAKKQLGEP